MHPYSRGALKNQEILLANSSEQNLCEKICSYRGAKLDENRTSTPTNSTIMQSIGAVCRLVVISPAVSGRFWDAGYGLACHRHSSCRYAISRFIASGTSLTNLPLSPSKILYPFLLIA